MSKWHERKTHCFLKLGKVRKDDALFWGSYHSRYMQGESFVTLGEEIGLSDISLKKIFLDLGFPLRSKEQTKAIAVTKRRKTFTDRYGVEHIAKLKSFRDSKKPIDYAAAKEKRAATIKSDPDYYKKKSKTLEENNLKRFGVRNVFQLETVKEKSKETNRKKYGVDFASQSPLIKKIKKTSVLQKNSFEWGEIFSKLGFELLEPYKGVTLNGGHIKYKMRHLSCDTVFYRDLLREPICKCQKKAGFSGAEEKVYKYLRELLGEEEEILCNQRMLVIGGNKPSEVDIYLPRFKVAIEYNGTFFHSSYFEKYRNDYRIHQKKSDAALKLGVSLYHIWDFVKEDIWKSKLAYIFNKTKVKINARECSSKVITADVARNFLSLNHVDGFAKSKIHYGLFKGGDLVAVISLRKHKKYDWEIARFAVKNHTSVRGAFTKLFKVATKGLRGSILTYADRDWSPMPEKTIYSGFEFVGGTSPKLLYTDLKSIIPRQKLQKHKLKISEPITAREALENMGIYSIHTSGNWKYLGSLS